ncbi:MAG: hypothetical protein DMG33_11485 [Acidobacteria bacterium]|nr:MAG: hypothetical protein DMG33_11485 [Acidobacteriota bacterium]
MNLDRLGSLLSHVFSVAAFVLLALGVVEWLANAMGYTILGQVYRPGRLMEFAAIFAVFVVALLLRQVRQEIRKGGRAS